MAEAPHPVAPALPSVAKPGEESPWQRLTPALFVLLWASGFASAKLGLLYAPPLTFLALRLVIVALLLYLAALVFARAWPQGGRQLGHVALVGLLLHGFYLGGVYLALSWGVEAGTSAMIVSTQPLLVAALAGPLLKERVTRRQWLGLALGMAGVGLVVWRKAGLDLGALEGALLCVFALCCITASLLYQKRYLQRMPFLAGNALQFVAAGAAILMAALIFEDWRIDWTWEFAAALAWLVVVLSLGAVGLLILLMRRGAASRVASLFFLVPPVAALMAWAVQGETLSPLELAGMALVAAGVALVNLGSR